MSIYQKHMEIMNELFVPKGHTNDFGGYRYRSCEDIVKAIKPILANNGCTLYMNNKIVQISDRFYVEAEAILIDIETGESISAKAQAREELEKKKSDASQITGAASSYARKYALAGLFCIDNEKDSDATNLGDDAPVSKEDMVKDAENRTRIMKYINSKKEPDKAQEFILSRYKVDGLGKLTSEQVTDCIKFFEAKGEQI